MIVAYCLTSASHCVYKYSDMNDETLILGDMLH